MINVVTTPQYQKALKKLKKQNKTETIKKLDEIIGKLARFEITTEYKNHKLKGTDVYDLHVEPDLILLYRYVGNAIVISLELADLVNHDKLKSALKNIHSSTDVRNNDVLTDEFIDSYLLAKMQFEEIYHLQDGYVELDGKGDVDDTVAISIHLQNKFGEVCEGYVCVNMYNNSSDEILDILQTGAETLIRTSEIDEELVESSVTGAADGIDGYWFFTRHGVQPGSVPKDVEILDIIDTAEGTFVKFNRFLSTKELNYYDMVEKAPEGITSAEDVQDDDVYEDIKEIGQEFTSENTSINSKKVPAVFKMVHFEPGTVNCDFGGGKFNTAAEYLEQYDVVNLVYNPYNRSSEHNREVIRLIREHGGADTATCSNVLNVIKEPEVRLNVLKNISKLVKAGGTIYITVYEGKGNNEGTPTKSGYQLNRKTADYLEEIQEVFPECKRRGKLIECVNSGAIMSSIYDDDTSWILLERKSVPDESGFYTDYCLYQNEDETEYVCIFGDRDVYTPDNTEPDAEFDTYEEAKEWFDYYEGFVDEDDIYSSTMSDMIPKLKEELKSAVTDTMLSEEFGFSENEVEQYSAIDVYVKDNSIVCEIRAEVSFDGLMELCDNCNQVVEKYYKDAYFDPEEPGIATAYIPINDITGAITAMEDSMLEPPEPKEYDEVTEEFEIEVDLSGVVIQLEDNSWDYEDDSYEFAANEDGKDYRSEYGVYVDDTTGVVEKIDELIEKDIPIGTGRYELSGYVYLVYDVTGIDSDKDYYPDGDYEEEIYTDNAKAEFNFEKSYVKDFQIKKL